MSQESLSNQHTLDANLIPNASTSKTTSSTSTPFFPISSRKLGTGSGSHISLSPPYAVPYWYRATDTPKYPTKPLDKSSNARTTTEPLVPPLNIGRTGTNPPTSSFSPSSSTYSEGTSSINYTQPLSPSITSPTISPSSWTQFSASEASKLETMYQKIQQYREQFTQDEEVASRRKSYPFDVPLPFAPVVPLGHDRLMEVDVDKGILYPIYWSGPMYEVRRSIWYCLGAGTKWIPCDPSLNRQLEEGYLKIQPWLFKQSSLDSTQVKYDVPEHRHALFGSYLSKFAIYTSATTAWVMEDSVSAKIQQAVLVKLTSGVNLGGQKVIRGYDNLPPVIKDREAKEKELLKQSNKPEGQSVISEEPSGSFQSSLFPISIDSRSDSEEDIPIDHLLFVIHGVGAKLSEHLESVNFVSDVGHLRNGIHQALLSKEDPKVKKKEVFVLPIQWRQSVLFAVEATEVEASDDEENVDVTENKVEKEFTFTQEQSNASVQLQSVSSFSSCKTPPEGIHSSRASVKSANSIISSSEALSSEPFAIGSTEMNLSSGSNVSGQNSNPSNIPLTSVDLSSEHKKLPSLDEIMLQGVPTIRTLVTDVVLDVLLFMTPKYKTQILNTVVRELNRVYFLFLSRHPKFNGTVSILGHSLGSVVAMEIVSETPYRPLSVRPTSAYDAHIPHIDKCYPKSVSLTTPVPSFSLSSSSPQFSISRLSHTDHLTFEVEHLFCTGSPMGYFLLLQGERLRPRRHSQDLSTITTKRPRVKNLYNIFSQYDPVAVRMEPLISRAFVNTPPFLIPYQKGGLKGLQQGVENVTSRAMDALRLSSGYISSIFRPLTQPVMNEKSQNSSESKTNDTNAFNGIRILNSRYGRVDFAMQQGLLENPYLAALSIHTCYWSDVDIANFLAGEITCEPHA